MKYLVAAIASVVIFVTVLESCQSECEAAGAVLGTETVFLTGSGCMYRAEDGSFKKVGEP